MRTFTLATLLIAVGFTASAQIDSSADVRSRVLLSSGKLESEIAQKLKDETKLTSLSQFYVDWKNMKCTGADGLDIENAVGNCLVSVSAFQIKSSFSLAVTEGSILPILLIAIVE